MLVAMEESQELIEQHRLQARKLVVVRALGLVESAASEKRVSYTFLVNPRCTHRTKNTLFSTSISFENPWPSSTYAAPVTVRANAVCDVISERTMVPG